MRTTDAFLESDQLLVFDHIPKTGGHTVRYVFQQNFGWGHFDAEPNVDRSKLQADIPASEHFPLRCMAASPPQMYGSAELRQDLLIHPRANSFASHMAVPFVDFGRYDDRLLWFTMFRDPVRRFLSHYQMNQGEREEPMELHEWAERLPLKNQQTHWIAGRPDVEAAKEILREKFLAVGLVEEFDKSLLLLREKLAPWFVVDYPQAQNVAKNNSLREHVRANWGDYNRVVEEWNALDIELYEFVKNEIWSEQVESYGPARLERDVEGYFHRGNAPRLREQLKQRLSVGFRRAVYKPFTDMFR